VSYEESKQRLRRGGLGVRTKIPLPQFPLTVRQLTSRRGKAVVVVSILVCCIAILHLFIFPDPDIDSIFTNDELEVFAYEGVRPTEMCRIGRHSAAAVEIRSMLTRHRRRWMLNFSSFVPHLFISGQSFSLDVGDQLLVLNCIHHGRKIQVISPAQSADLRRLRDELRGEMRPFRE
jgi:hypothetical protein